MNFMKNFDNMSEEEVQPGEQEVAPGSNEEVEPPVDGSLQNEEPVAEVAPGVLPAEVAIVPVEEGVLNHAEPLAEPVFGEYGYVLQPGDEGYVEAELDNQHADQPADPDYYTVQAADLNAYPELSQQGVQLHDQVKIGSLYVWKWTTAAHDSSVREVWPRPIGAEKGKGITFNG